DDRRARHRPDRGLRLVRRSHARFAGVSGRGGGFGRLSTQTGVGGGGRGRGMLGMPPDPATRVPPERRGRTIRHIASFFRPYRGSVAIVLVAILFTSLLGLINPILLKLLIDDAIPR